MNENIEKIIKNNIEEIKADLLADEVEFGSVQGFTKEWNLNGEEVTLGVIKK